LTPRAARRLGAALLLLGLALPALVAAASLDQPPGPGERERLVRAAGAAAGARSLVADAFLRLLLPAAADPATVPLPRARLASVFAIALTTSLLYLLLALSRGRATALLACLALAAFAPVAAAGARLRPELPATLLGVGGVLALLAMPRLRGARRAPAARTFAAIAAAAVLFALAAAALPAAAVHLLVPAALLVLQLAVRLPRLPRLLRRRAVPWRAWWGRLAPWALLVVACGATTAAARHWLVLGDPAALPPTPSEFDLWPRGLPARAALLLLVVLGAVRYVLGIGMRLGRTRRITPSVVLLCYVAALLVQRALAPPGTDALPAAVPAALLAADGAFLVLVLGVSLTLRRA
jgi:hypothetical protein